MVVLFFSHTWVYPAVILLLSIVGASEMLRCVGVWKELLLSVPSMLYAALCPFLAMEYRYGVLMAATMGYLFIMLFMLVFAHEKVNTERVCTAYTMIVYITICFVCLIRLRYVTTETGMDTGRMVGQYIYLLVFYCRVDYRHVCLFYRRVFRQAQALSEGSVRKRRLKVRLAA